MASQLVLWPKLVPNGLRHGKLGLFRGTSFQTDLKKLFGKKMTPQPPSLRILLQKMKNAILVT